MFATELWSPIACAESNGVSIYNKTALVWAEEKNETTKDPTPGYRALRDQDDTTVHIITKFWQRRSI